MDRKFNRQHRLLAIGIVFILLCNGLNSAYADFEIEEIAPGVYVHIGLQEQITFKNKGDISNISFIICDDSVAVIDTGGSGFVADELIKKIKQITELPIKYVILTHAHPDHVFGLKRFVDQNESVEIIGHKHLSNALVQRGEFYRQRFMTEQGFESDDLGLVPPTITVDSELVIDLGGCPLKLTAYPTSHTDNDLVVYDSESKTFWAGDLIFRQRVPVIDGNVKTWLNTMEQLMAIEVNNIVPGHGPVAHDWGQAMDDQKRYFSKVIDGVRQILDQGGSIQSAVESVAQDESEKWLLFDDHHGQNVSRAFSELEWE